MKVRTAQFLRTMLLAIGFVMALASYIYEPLFISGVVVMFSCLIPDILFNKCPHCGKHLGRNSGDYCQFCGKPIDE